ncbi:MAG: acyltransferase family protein [Hyphomicrobium sp.]
MRHAQEIDYRVFGGLRLLLAVLVLVQHTLHAMAPRWVEDWLAPYGVGSMAVLVFFVLSGFIVCEAAERFYRQRAGAFLVNRMLRIYPSYLIALVFTIASAAVITAFGRGEAMRQHIGGDLAFTVTELAANIVGILPGGKTLMARADVLPVLDIAWALRVELLFYAILFAAVLAARILRREAAQVLALFALVLLAVSSAENVGVRTGMLEFVPYFVCGGAVYYALVAQSGRWFAVGIALVALVLSGMHVLDQQVTSVVPIEGYDHGLKPFVVFTALMLAWIFLLALPYVLGRLPPALARIDQVLGDLTYPLYIWHTGTTMLVSAVLPERGWDAFLGGVIVSLAVAALVAQTIERRIGGLRAKVRGVTFGTAVPGTSVPV